MRPARTACRTVFRTAETAAHLVESLLPVDAAAESAISWSRGSALRGESAPTQRWRAVGHFQPEPVS